jgi:heme/copper-type cytochrome/quinol oxidase subunit 3
MWLLYFFRRRAQWRAQWKSGNIIFCVTTLSLFSLVDWRYFQFVPSLFLSPRSCLKVMERLTKKVFRIQSRFISAIFLVDSARANRKARPHMQRAQKRRTNAAAAASFITKQLCAEFAGICFERR